MLILAWVREELRSREPLVDMRMMAIRGVWTTNTVAFLIGVGMYSSFVLLPEMVQEPVSTGYGFGSSVTAAGLFLLPSTIAIIVVGQMAGVLERRIGSRMSLIGGAVFALASYVLVVVDRSQPWEIYVVSGLLGIGIGLSFSAMANLIVQNVRQDQTGVATGMNAVTRTLGGAFGGQIAATLLADNLGAGGDPDVVRLHARIPDVHARARRSARLRPAGAEAQRERPGLRARASPAGLPPRARARRRLTSCGHDPPCRGRPPLLARPPGRRALAIAAEVEAAGLDTLWIGELVSFDAFALATAIGTRTSLRLKVGPLAVGVRSPVSIALGISSVATLTGRDVGVALGASSPVMVSGWHDRDWAHAASRMRETIESLRQIMSGERSSYDGQYVRTNGFRLRRPMPGIRITVAAFGPAMTRVAARHADEVVLNLVPPDHVAGVRETLDAEAAAAGRPAPELAVWVPAALEPDDAARTQLASQLAVYLGAPGYGEMFSELGFGDVVQRAREGARRSELAEAVPFELIAQVCATGSAAEVAARISAYHDAGADTVGIAPSTASDPGGRGVLRAGLKALR